jgi:hypothetical protein
MPQSISSVTVDVLSWSLLMVFGSDSSSWSPSSSSRNPLAIQPACRRLPWKFRTVSSRGLLWQRGSGKLFNFEDSSWMTPTFLFRQLLLVGSFVLLGRGSKIWGRSLWCLALEEGSSLGWKWSVAGRGPGLAAVGRLHGPACDNMPCYVVPSPLLFLLVMLLEDHAFLGRSSYLIS